MPELNRTTHISFPDAQDTSLHDITSGIAEGSLSLEEILLTGNLDFGQCNANKFEVQLYGIANVANQRIRVWTVENEGTQEEEEIPLFVGYVDSCKQDNMGYYRDIVAYDAIYYKGDMNVANWWTSFWANHNSATLKTLRDGLCAFVNIPTVAGTFFNDDLVVYKAVSMTVMSFKDTLAQICELQCIFPNINRNGYLEFISLDMSDAEDIRGLYKKADSSFEDFVTQKIDAVSIYGIDSAIAGTTDPTSVAKNTYNISGNCIAYGVEEGTETALAQSIYNHIKELQYVPLDVVLISSDLTHNLGDYIQTDNGYSFIFSNSLSGSMLVEQKVSADGDEFLSGTKKSQNAEITALRAQVETLTDDVIANALVSYQAVNAQQAFTITDEWVKVIDFSGFNVITTETTDLIFMGNINLTIESDEYFDTENNRYEYTPAEVEVRYVLNDGVIDYHPKQDYDDGQYILPLNYQVVGVPALQQIGFEVWLKTPNGEVDIGAGDAIGYLMGQKLKINEPVSLTVYTAGLVTNYVGDPLSYEGLVVNATYENGMVREVTDKCTYNPVEGVILAESGTLFVDVTFGEIETSFTIEVVVPTNFLKYLTYEETETAYIITGLNEETIIEDRPEELEIPSNYRGKIIVLS